jgi:hypothetical protein
MANFNSKHEKRKGARLVLIVAMVVPLLTSVYAQAAGVSGKWSGSSSDNSPMGTVFAVLKQEGTTLTGTAGPSESKQLPIVSGKVDGDRLTFEVKMGGGTLRFDLTNAGSELRGTVQLSDGGGHTDSSRVVLKSVS